MVILDLPLQITLKSYKYKIANYTVNSTADYSQLCYALFYLQLNSIMEKLDLHAHKRMYGSYFVHV